MSMIKGRWKTQLIFRIYVHYKVEFYLQQPTYQTSNWGQRDVPHAQQELRIEERQNFVTQRMPRHLNEDRIVKIWSLNAKSRRNLILIIQGWVPFS